MSARLLRRSPLRAARLTLRRPPSAEAAPARRTAPARSVILALTLLSVLTLTRRRTLAWLTRFAGLPRRRGRATFRRLALRARRDHRQRHVPPLHVDRAYPDRHHV